MNADGSNPRNLTRHPLNDGRDGGYAWSPDGRKILFATNRDRNRGRDGKVATELYVMNADGSGQRRLTRTSEWEYVHSWSPDGRKLVFDRFPIEAEVGVLPHERRWERRSQGDVVAARQALMRGAPPWPSRSPWWPRAAVARATRPADGKKRSRSRSHRSGSRSR